MNSSALDTMILISYTFDFIRLSAFDQLASNQYIKKHNYKSSLLDLRYFTVVTRTWVNGTLENISQGMI